MRALVVRVMDRGQPECQPAGPSAGIGAAGLGFAVATVVGRVYLPGGASSADQFGVLGLAFSYIGWLFVLMSVLLVAVTIGRVIHLALIGHLWSRSGEVAEAHTAASRGR